MQNPTQPQPSEATNPETDEEIIDYDWFMACQPGEARTWHTTEGFALTLDRRPVVIMQSTSGASTSPTLNVTTTGDVIRAPSINHANWLDLTVKQLLANAPSLGDGSNIRAYEAYMETVRMLILRANELLPANAD